MTAKTGSALSNELLSLLKPYRYTDHSVDSVRHPHSGVWTMGTATNLLPVFGVKCPVQVTIRAGEVTIRQPGNQIQERSHMRANHCP